MKEKFINSMLFKHLVLANDYKELIKMLNKSDDSFGFFLDLAEDSFEMDPNFFMIDSSIPSSVESVIENYRFNPEYRKYSDRANDLIKKMNVSISLPNDVRRDIIDIYTEEQADLRCLEIGNLYELKYLLRNDMIIYQTLLDGNMNQPTLYLIEEASCYFLNSCPELYDDEEFLANSCDVLDDKKANLNIRENNLRKTLIKEMKNLKK